MIIRDEIAYPDPRDVKRLRWMYAAIIVAMLVVLLCLRLWIDSQISTVDNPKAVRSVFLVLSGAIAGPVLAFWFWISLTCRRVLRTQQWPHPGAKLDRPVAVLRGRKACNKAWTLLALVSIFSIAAVVASVYLYFSVGARFESLMEIRLQESKAANKLLHATCEDARA
jgi:hypothetical protein